MAGTTTAIPSSCTQAQSSPLVRELARVLPKDSRFTAWHLSTTPAVTEALCYPPALNSTTDKRPSKPLKTYCEKHFLALSVPEPATAQEVLVLGLEIYIYSTAFSTTVFVSKADSTGYLPLQSTPQGFSPIRAVTAEFLRFLVEHRRRRSKQLVINLFARAQSQYLFPGSVNNSQKHILDDRGLIKWWCKVLNALLEHDDQNKSTTDWDRIHGYLVVPGLDNYETRVFVPRTDNAKHNWTLGDPLELISPYKHDTANFENVPLRCLIPTYPDDPKARFIQELEDSTSQKAKLLAGWKIPKTFDQFWEMMAFRQECSSGRMTGFIWVVFEPPRAPISLPERHSNPKTAANDLNDDGPLTHNRPPGNNNEAANLAISPKLASASTKPPRSKRRAKKILKGPIMPREPRVKTRRTKYPDHIMTPYYYWPVLGRGQVVLDDNGYNRAVELLLHLEFKGLEQAIASTSRWVSEVNMGENWALPIVGEKIIPTQPASSTPGPVNKLTGSLTTNRRNEDGSVKDTEPGRANMLGGGLVRKKAKVEPDEKPVDIQGANATTAGTIVNVLGSGFVRKKTKPS